ncbi:MAG: tetratricopeptide repeat protein [Pirellulaceae bacterium]|nr:tetratricopeptide repeat protein [Pirellulaceae bacterium]
MAAPLSWRKKLLFSAITLLLFFALLEGGLAVIGFRPVTDEHDPFVGFAGYLPLFEEQTGEDGQTEMITAENKLVWFNDQVFLKKKPEGVYRIFCLGGSTTYGRPFRDPTSFAGWLREFLPAADSSREWEVINAGGVSYASYRVSAVMEELAEYEPDLFIVYSVHNEFLERRTYGEMFAKSQLSLKINAVLSRTRTWAAIDHLIRRDRTVPEDESKSEYIMPAEVDEMLNHTVGPVDYHRDPEWRGQVIKHYELNLNRMADIAERCGAKMMLVSPASNIKDCSPFKSELAEGTSEEDENAFWDNFQEAEELVVFGKNDEALAAYEEALKIDDTCAHLQYRLGKLYVQMERHEDANKAFERAVNEDICPLRAVDEIVELNRRIAEQRNALFVDFGKLLNDVCQEEHGHTNLGAEYFLDHVHPTIDVHRRMALWILDEMARAKIVTTSDQWTEEKRDEIAENVLAMVDSFEQGVALRNLAKVLHWAGKFDEAGPIAEQAMLLITDDFESMYIAAECIRHVGEPQEALPYYQKLVEQDVFFWQAHIPLGGLLADRKDYEGARDHLTIGVALQPDGWYAHQELGIAHFHLGEYKLALESLTEADKQGPEDPRTLYFMARTQVELGMKDEALKMFREVLKLDESDPATHNHLGALLMDMGELKDAIKHLEIAVESWPDYEEADINLQNAKEMLEKKK